MKGLLRSLMGLSIFLLVFVSPLSAIGTREDQSEDIFSLGEVNVTASSLTSIEAGETVHVITADEIKKTSARTLDEVLVLLPDVNIKVGTDGVPRVEMRGAKGKDILVLLDGVPINSAFDGQFDASAIPVETISKVKVTVGASSVLYGQGGLGGVINIITKKGKKGLKGSVGYEGGDGSPYLAKAGLSGGTDKWDFFLSGSAFHRDRFPLSQPFTSSIYEEAGYRKNSDNTRNNAFLSLGFTPNDDWHFSLTGNYVTGGYGKPASAINNNFDPYAPRAQFGRVDDYEGIQLQLGADYTPTEALEVRGRVYYSRMDQDNNNYDNDDYDTFDDPLIPNSYKLRNSGIKAGANLQPTYDFGRAGTLSLNLMAEQDTWDATGGVKPGGGAWARGGHGIGAGSPPYILYPVSDHHVFYVYSAGAEYKIDLVRNLVLTVGVAENWQVRSDATLSDYGFSGSLYYDIFKGTRLKAAFMRTIRFPTLSELYLRPSDNPGLVQEKAWVYQAGVEQKLPWGSRFELNGFYNDVRDYIGLQQTLFTPQQGFVAYNINFPHIRLQGFEAALETNFVKRFKLKLAYTLDASRNLSGPDYVGDGIQLQYVPKNKVVFTGRYDFDFGLTPFFSVVYVSDSVVYSKQTYVTVSRAYMTPYVVVNFKLSQRLFNDRLTIYAGADNIMNRNYEDTYGIPRPGRYIFGGFEYRF